MQEHLESPRGVYFAILIGVLYIILLSTQLLTKEINQLTNIDFKMISLTSK